MCPRRGAKSTLVPALAPHSCPRACRKSDTLVRWGGDEFIVILPETKLEDAAFVAERLRRAMCEHVFLASEGLTAHLTASFGVASFPETCSSEAELIRLADQAMYRVKNRTRNGVYLATVTGDEPPAEEGT